MKYLYLDNFRGFKDTLIPLTDVNFLVGENSTGKTSVMSLFNILNSQEFRFSGYLRNSLSQIEMGNFEDLSNDKKFTIGYISEGNAFFISYINYKNHLFVIQFTGLSAEGNGSHIYFRKENESYVKLPLSKKILETNDITTKIDEIITIHREELINELKGADNPPSPSSLPMLFHWGFEGYSHSLDSIKKDIKWIAPIRAEFKRIYENLQYGYSPDGSHIPALLNEILSDKEHKLSIELIKMLKNFGEESGLFKEIKPAKFNKEDKKSPFELNVILNKEPLKISNVGYGVSQVLPIIVESFIQENDTTFCIQQPEVHLHPKAQAALGGFFYDVAELDNKQFLIETHSDFLIDRFRLRMKEAKEKKVTAQVLYFERTAEGNKCTPIEIMEDGKYTEKNPETLESFRQFFMDELDRILEI